MAIIDKNQSPEKKYPVEVLEALQVAVEHQKLKDAHQTRYNELRDKAIESIRDADGLTLIVGETLETPVCDISSYYKKTTAFDQEKMVALVIDGKIPLQAFLSCVKGFDGDLVKAVFAGQDVSTTITAKKPTYAFKVTAGTAADLQKVLDLWDGPVNTLHLGES